MALREEDRFAGYLALNIAHPWQTPRSSAAQSWRFLMYQPLIATLGVPLHRRTRFVEYLIRAAISDRSRVSLAAIRCFSERFRDQVCAETARDTYRTFLTREVPAIMRHPETRRLSMPVRALHGVDDQGVHYSLASERTALADDYEVSYVDRCGHFIADERPELVREHLIALAAATDHYRYDERQHA